jgi:predicted outer membrane repeat protein
MVAANSQPAMKTLLAGLPFLLINTVGAFGLTLTVVNHDDNGAGSLRDAIANASPGDTIVFDLPTPDTITLTTDELLIDKNLTIAGPGDDNLTVMRSSAGGVSAFRIFHVGLGNLDVAVSGLTVSNGKGNAVIDSGQGGGLFNESSGNVSFSECTFRDNQAATNGGGVCQDGPGALVLTDCLITGNTSVFGYAGGLAAENSSGSVTLLRCTVSLSVSNFQAGGIYNFSGSIMSLTDSTVSDNRLTIEPNGGAGDGGGIFNDGTLTMANCTIARNTNARGSGAGIINQGTATIVNSTFFGNTAAQDGGAVFSVGPTTLTYCTITRNTALQKFVTGRTYDGGGGLSNFDVQFLASTTLRDTIVADNNSPVNPDIAGTITSEGYNLIGDATGGTIIPSIGDQIGTAGFPIDPLLRPLANNGGTTDTCALRKGSPAIDKGGRVVGISTDQRGQRRPIDDPTVPPAPQGNNSDIGSFESRRLR